MSSVKRARLAGREAATAAVLLVPCVVGLGIFFAYPLVANVYYSFTNYDLLSDASWVGMENYKFMFTQDQQFWQAVGNTLLFVALSVPLQVLYSILLAVLVTSVKRMSIWYRTIFYLPALLPPVAATMGFAFVFNPGTGQVNRLLDWLHLPTPLWLHDPVMARWVFIAMVLWGAGNTIVVMIAGVLNVPEDLYEAASLDGAGPLRKLRHITLPMLRPVIVFATVTGMIAALQFFTQPYVANQITAGSNTFVVGYPDGGTMFYTTWIYQQAFSFFNVGYGSALSSVMFVFALFFTIIVLKIGNFTEGTSE